MTANGLSFAPWGWYLNSERDKAAVSVNLERVNATSAVRAVDATRILDVNHMVFSGTRAIYAVVYRIPIHEDHTDVSITSRA